MLNIIKGQQDSREYKLIVLENKMRCLIISDPDCDKSAGALDVHVGSALDPKPLFGTAHFLEHMLFMGTEKYPSENEYNQFISDNSGYTNAYTSLTNTNYQFEVGNSGFHEGLDRFAQFFICPLIGESSTEREMQAVDSEFQQTLQHDGWNTFSLLQNMAHKESYYNTFSVGNLETLKQPGIRESLLEFHKKWYSANIMTLCILNNAPIETLEAQVKELFSQIKNFDVVVPDLSNPICFDEQNTGNLIKFFPVKDKDILTFVWCLPFSQNEFKKQPLSYISSLFGNEGPDSLLSYLMKEDLVSALQSSCDHDLDCLSFFNLELTLTKKGFEEYEKVISLVFDYCESMANIPPQQYYFDEIQSIGKTKFRFQEKKGAFNYVVECSSTMQKFQNLNDLTYLLSHRFYPMEFDPLLIKESLNLMARKFNFNLMFQSKKFDNLPLRLPFRFTQYQIIPMEYTRVKINNFVYPPSNPYITTDFSLVPISDQKLPIKIQNSHQDLYFFQEDVHRVPKMFINLKLYINEKPDLQGYTFKKLFERVFQQITQEICYQAELAGVYSSYSMAQDHLYMQVFGYNKGVSVFVLDLLQQLKQVSSNNNISQLFQQAKEFCVQQIVNKSLEQTYKQIGEQLNTLLNYNDFTHEEYLIALQNFQEDQFINEILNWLESGHLVQYIHGNLDKEEAVKLADNIGKQLNIKKLDKKFTRTMRRVQLDKQYIYDKQVQDQKNENSCVLSHFQIGLYNNKLNLLLACVMQFINEPCFNQLRTIEQLGYVVFSYSGNNLGVLSSNILVQSQKFCAEHCNNSIDSFLESMKERFINLTDDEFKTIIQSVKTDICQKDLNMAQRNQRFWLEIHECRLQFDKQAILEKMLDSINKQELIDFFEHYFVKNQKRIDYQMHADSHKNIQGKLRTENSKKKNIILDIHEFKEAQGLWADLRKAGLLKC